MQAVLVMTNDTTDLVETDTTELESIDGGQICIPWDQLFGGDILWPSSDCNWW